MSAGSPSVTMTPEVRNPGGADHERAVLGRGEVGRGPAGQVAHQLDADGTRVVELAPRHRLVAAVVHGEGRRDAAAHRPARTSVPAKVPSGTPPQSSAGARCRSTSGSGTYSRPRWHPTSATRRRRSRPPRPEPRRAPRWRGASTTTRPPGELGTLLEAVTVQRHHRRPRPINLGSGGGHDALDLQPHAVDREPPRRAGGQHLGGVDRRRGTGIGIPGLPWSRRGFTIGAMRAHSALAGLALAAALAGCSDDGDSGEGAGRMRRRPQAPSSDAASSPRATRRRPPWRPRTCKVRRCLPDGRRSTAYNPERPLQGADVLPDFTDLTKTAATPTVLWSTRFSGVTIDSTGRAKVNAKFPVAGLDQGGGSGVDRGGRAWRTDKCDDPSLLGAVSRFHL